MTDWDVSTSLNVLAYCDAALCEMPLAVIAGTTAVAFAWYEDGCSSMNPPTSRPAATGMAMTSQRIRRIARR